MNAIQLPAVTHEFSTLMQSRGQTVSHGDLEFVSLISAAWQSERTNPNPIVFAAECGFGKSTLLELFLRHKTASDPYFGAIIVKQKRDEVEALSVAINRNLTEDGREQVRYRRAFAIRGYDPLQMTYRSYRKQFERQAYYPVVIMTAEMLARQSSMRLLDRFSSFYDGDRQRRPRRLLIIDERPVITRNHSVSVEDVNRLIVDVRAIGLRKYNGKEANYFREFLEYAQRLRHEIESCSVAARIEPVDFEYTLPEELRKDWGDDYEGDNFDMLGTFESAIRFGGAVSFRRGGVPVVSVSQRIYYEWTQYNSFILDATAKTDPYYASDKFDVIEAPTPHLYRNVYFNVCPSENLSRSFFEAHPQSFDEVAAMVKEIAAKQRKTMVVFYKEHLSRLEELLAEEIECGAVLTKHFDSGRATNEYKDCDAAIFLGWLLKGDTYYPQVASAIYSELLPLDHDINISGIRYSDARVESFKTGELVTERIQDVHRIRPRSSTYPINVYLFHRDGEIIRKIIESFPGSIRREFTPLRRLSGKVTHADNLIGYFQKMESGQRTKSKEIYESLGISARQFSRLQEDPRVVEAMRQYRVIKDRTFYSKL
ncbi:hypothetical protein ACFSL6_17080 [Paenibacillus thailandensis]|uniref:ATP-binding protein n=1 Tax=Paenibacillus thailandensis TaxID=393250 RepID=A0ABW5QZ17_9BACL